MGPIDATKMTLYWPTVSSEYLDIQCNWQEYKITILAPCFKFSFAWNTICVCRLGRNEHET